MSGSSFCCIEKDVGKDMFLFGSTSASEDSAIERVYKINDKIMKKYHELFPDTTQLEHFIHVDLGAELGVDSLKNEASEYSASKELAIKASKVIDVENIKHLAKNKELDGDGVEKTAAEWDSQKDLFYQRKGFGQHQKDDDDFGRELEEALSFELFD